MKMLLLTDYELKFIVDTSQEFLNLQDKVYQYNWNLDPEVSKCTDTDLAFFDSFVMHCCITPTMLKINPRYNSIRFHDSSIEIENLIRLLTNKIVQKIGNVTLLKSMLVALKPNGFQRPHRDLAPHHAFCHRLVIPITSNSQCVTYFDDRPALFELGHVYETNNQIKHYSVNRGEQIRVYMFVDLIPNSCTEQFLSS